MSISLGALRGLTTLFLAQVMTQVVLAASFVSGNTATFQLHSLNGSLMNVVPFLLVVTALVHATAARGAWWPMLASIALLALCFVQEVLGYARVIGAHIVGGTLILSISLLLCVSLWRHRPAPRARRDPGPAPAVPRSAAGVGEVRS